jgi:prolyl-tRNA synthetase
MRWSRAFIPTLRDDPADAEAVSHRLLVRGGFIRQLAAGSYTMLPLGQRVRLKVAGIIREEMDAIGGQEMMLPALHPAEIWRKSGRYDLMGDSLFRLRDRRGADLVLGMTEEEIFAILATELFSYRDLPQIWYQVHTKFRDEPRPKSGLLRVREFTMKDSYTLDIDAPGLDTGFDKHHEAYMRIFARMGLEAVDVQASSGAMGGTVSTEFMVRSDAGEDWIVTCDSCDYRANVEKATSALDPIDDGDHTELGRFPTPGLRTIRALAQAHPDIAAPARQIKTLVFSVDGEMVLVLLRGDHDLQEQKLIDATAAANVRPGQPEEIRELLGADPGSLGAVGVEGLRVIADRALEGRVNMTTGANEDDWHLMGVDVARDVPISGEPISGSDIRRGVCVTVALSALERISRSHLQARHQVLRGSGPRPGREGNSHPVIMGSYGIGLERGIAAVVERNHDESGIIWPIPIAPYEVVITVIRPDDEATLAVANRLYAEFASVGIEVILDDRAERPGVKFADAELVGIPHRVTVGPKGVESGVAEVTERRGMVRSELAFDRVVPTLAESVKQARSGI